MKLLKILKSSWLCLKYPFLYPRNRFDGKHHNNFLMSWLYKLNRYSQQKFHFTCEFVEKTRTNYSKWVNLLEYVIELDKENFILKITYRGNTTTYDVSKLISKNKFELLGIESIFSYSGTPIIKFLVTSKDLNSAFFCYDTIYITKNKWYNFWYKIIEFLDKFLDYLWILPSYTEWDDMPEGWNKAFGKQYLKELKTQLKKDKMLYKWRILQLKEKYGTLRLYCNYGSRELYQIIQKYEDLSWNTCIKCGKPATLISDGYICPYCDECFPKNYTIQYRKINGEWV